MIIFFWLVIMEQLTLCRTTRKKTIESCWASLSVITAMLRRALLSHSSSCTTNLAKRSTTWPTWGTTPQLHVRRYASSTNAKEGSTTGKTTTTRTTVSSSRYSLLKDITFPVEYQDNACPHSEQEFTMEGNKSNKQREFEQRETLRPASSPSPHHHEKESELKYSEKTGKITIPDEIKYYWSICGHLKRKKDR